MSFGLLGSLQYVFPGFAKSFFSFEQVRPLHVSSVVFWIILGAVGTLYTYSSAYFKTSSKYNTIIKIQFYLFLISIVSIVISYCLSIFGGREYWEFPPIFSLPIIISWILVIFVFYKTLPSLKNQPVYVWMWLTGVLFFLFTFLESNLWVIPFFRNHYIKDMTIQWKSYGSMVGSWNMLLYGSSFFLLEKISNDSSNGKSRIAFLLYFTGLFNLMFNWGHHIYTLPTHDYVKHISYAVSMTELFIFGRIIYLWKSSLSEAKKYSHIISYRFLFSVDVWVFLTLCLAIFMSVPGINVYTHGTHITVAHTMGATIGINSFLLFAFAFDIIYKENSKYKSNNFSWAFWILNSSLFVFWLSLITAGLYKAIWQMEKNHAPFSIMMNSLKPFFIVFVMSGIILFLSLLYFAILLISNYFSSK
jgi:nitric oxide reductase subunit B